jgi:hypothetical protein
VEQQQYTGTFTRTLTPYLDANLSLLRVQNNQTAVLLRIDRRNYNSLSAGLNWRPVETWSVSAYVQAVRTQTADLAAGDVNQWRSAVTFTWSPFPKSRSW